MVSPFSMLFFFTLILGLVLCVSSDSWFGAWVGLELNLLSFIPLISSSSNRYSSESILKYFLVQVLASIMIIFSALFILMMVNLKMVFSLSLMLKLGAAPFHFWFPQVMEGLNWIQVVVLMTFQKVGPMILLSYLVYDKWSLIMIFTSAVVSAVVGAMGGLNQLYLRKIMAFSSINHMSWMFFAMILSEYCWLLYFSIYCLLSFLVIVNFYLQQAYHFSHLINSSFPLIPKIMSMMSLFSLGGLPPFLGFIPKWFIIQEMIASNYFYPLMVLLMCSLVTLYFYIRLSISFLTLMFPFSGWILKDYEGEVIMNGMMVMNFTGLLIPSLYMMC
uniref:NADH-ubiquinone oxidoreductase chain 2 n=1 Tax=Faxonius rusticus TaxID=2588666 RepID=A0A140GM00_FAXRU|nr:NADH dehydrogenase subunit 2 [Faxonius rusticus]AMN14358.1 NADH dehydrogenase subunit 2 [Faxonius rusticus]UZC55646.1 NADH dehydrogenase subunit 2 [Faxonius rusticus]